MNFILPYLSLGLFVLTFAACKGPEAQLLEDIETLEPLVEANPVDSNLKRLLVYYQRYVEQVPQAEESPVFLYRSAGWYTRVGNLAEASKQLERIIETYPQAEVRGSSIILAAMLYDERMNMSSRAKELYELYLKDYPQGPEVEKAHFFFRPENERLAKRIEQIQDTLFDKNERDKINLRAAFLLVQVYKDYTDRFPDDEKTPKYAYDGGTLAKNIGEFGVAVYLLKTFCERYPTHELHPEALFILGSTLENDLPHYRKTHQRQEDRRKQLDANYKKQVIDIADEIKEAELIYKEFLKKYPQHSMRPLVEQSLASLGKDPNDMAAEFARRLKEDRQKK